MALVALLDPYGDGTVKFFAQILCQGREPPNQLRCRQIGMNPQGETVGGTGKRGMEQHGRNKKYKKKKFSYETSLLTNAVLTFSPIQGVGNHLPAAR
jgi:hypothetical protein